MQPPVLSIILPVYNSEAILPHSLDLLRAWFASVPYAAELIIVNDGSFDGTKALVEAFARENAFAEAIHLPQNRGKGFAVKEGFKKAKGEYTVFTDADLSYGTAVFESMLAFMRAHPEASFAHGRRHKHISKSRIGYSAFRKVGSMVFIFFARLLAVPDVRDTQCGIKIFRQSILPVLIQKLTIDRFAFDVEIFVIARVNNFRYLEFPVEFFYEKNSSVQFVRDAIRMAFDVVKISLNKIKGVYTVDSHKI